MPRLNALFALLLAASGAFALWRAARALRTGSIAWRHWGLRRTTRREEDLTGFKAAVAIQLIGGLGFLLMAGLVLSH